jgi:HEAT repeat protein
MRSIPRLLACLLSVLCSGSHGEIALSEQGADTSNLVATAVDASRDVRERERALSGLTRLDFPAAAEIAPKLLRDKEVAIRFRAAWILADVGQSDGIDTLKSMAVDSGSERSTLAARALGRLRDGSSHALLRSLLEAELSRSDKQKALPRVSALVSSLSDYADPADSLLISKAIGRYLDDGADWVEADELGRTGGREAIPILREIFSGRGKGWAVMAAGLGLARCGSEEGAKYVSERLRDARCCRAPNGTPSDAFKDDPAGPAATSFLLDHIGIGSDEPLVPSLIHIVTDNEFSETARAQAWIALSRIDPMKTRPSLLELAWKSTGFDGAARLIVLNDESRAQSVAGSKQGKAGSEVSHALARALEAAPQERRRWRDTRGYAF